MEVEHISVSRRAVIAGLVATTAIGAAEAAVTPTLRDNIRIAAAHLATLLQELHGGIWYAHVDHDDHAPVRLHTPLVLITRSEKHHIVPDNDLVIGDDGSYDIFVGRLDHV